MDTSISKPLGFMRRLFTQPQQSETDSDLSHRSTGSRQQQQCRSLVCVQRAASKRAVVGFLAKTPQLVWTVPLVLDSRWSSPPYNNILIWNSQTAHLHVDAARHLQGDESRDTQLKISSTATTRVLHVWSWIIHLKFRDQAMWSSEGQPLKTCNKFCVSQIPSHVENKLFLSCGLRSHVRSRMLKRSRRYSLNMQFFYL